MQHIILRTLGIFMILISGQLSAQKIVTGAEQTKLYFPMLKGKNIGMGSAVFDVAECLGAKGNTQAKTLAF